MTAAAAIFLSGDGAAKLKLNIIVGIFCRKSPIFQMRLACHDGRVVSSGDTMKLHDVAGEAISAFQKEGTEETHLFKGRFEAGGRCTADRKSICQKMERADSDGRAFACKSDADARVACAKLGRAVCGTCVSSLYTTYP
jgi:hypothetical protein